jgi:hypothetical protein
MAVEGPEFLLNEIRLIDSGLQAQPIRLLVAVVENGL